jgi:hypothetical protein
MADYEERKLFIFEAVKALAALGEQSAPAVLELMASYVIMDEETRELILDALQKLGLVDPNGVLASYLDQMRADLMNEAASESSRRSSATHHIDHSASAPDLDRISEQEEDEPSAPSSRAQTATSRVASAPYDAPVTPFTRDLAKEALFPPIFYTNKPLPSQSVAQEKVAVLTFDTSADRNAPSESTEAQSKAGMEAVAKESKPVEATVKNLSLDIEADPGHARPHLRKRMNHIPLISQVCCLSPSWLTTLTLRRRK